MPADQTKRFSTWAIIPEEEVLIAFKIAYSTYTLDPYDFVGKRLKLEIWYPAGQTKIFPLCAILAEVEVVIALKIVDVSNTLDPYE